MPSVSGLYYIYIYIYINERGAIGGIKTGNGNQNTQRKYAPMPLFQPQIPNNLTPEDIAVHNHRCQNLKFSIEGLISFIITEILVKNLKACISPMEESSNM
jgi:hypothetical protein